MSLHWFGYNGFGQLHPHDSNRFMLSPTALNVSLFTTKFTDAKEAVHLHREGDNSAHQSYGRHDGSSTGEMTADLGAVENAFLGLFESSSVFKFSWNATFMHSKGGFILEGYQFGSKRDTVLKHLNDLSPLRDVCLHDDELFCIDTIGDCYVLQLKEEVGSNEVRLCKVTVSDKKQEAGAEESRQVTLDGLNCDEGREKFQCLSAGDMLTVAVHDGLAGSIHRKSDGFTFTSFPQPVDVRSVSCGKEHALMLTGRGLVYSFGLGSRGQLGHGDTGKEVTPRLVEALAGVAMVTVSAGGWHSTSISEIGDLYIWGWNESGQLGFPSKHTDEGAPSLIDDATSSPVLFHMIPELLDLPGGVNMSKVSCGSRHTAVVTGDNRLYTWGWGKYGQLGHGDRKTVDSPKHVEYFHRNRLWVVDVQCGDWNTIVRTCPAPRSATINPIGDT